MKQKPLAWKLRPETLEDFTGQTAILGKGKLLRRLIETDRIRSVVFYGPSGTGKSTLAHIITQMTRAQAIRLNAVTSRIDDIRVAVKKAEQELDRPTLLIIDEIHRFNKTQQDGLLPHVEDGTVILIGITMENPFFYLNKALLSRSHVFEFRSLSFEELEEVLDRVLKELKSQGQELLLSDKVKKVLIDSASGDARRLLNLIELLSDREGQGEISFEDLENLTDKKALVYDRDSDQHYDTISAFIKSVRGSDPDAAIYWCARMLESGEPPEFIARRLVILASEDVGNADPMGLMVAQSAFDACRVIGMPEARIILAQAVTYLASAPKSNSSYLAINEALADVRNGKDLPVPDHLRDSNFWSKKCLNHGKGYVYPHDHPYHFFDQDYLPEKRTYYQPGNLGFEKKIKQRLEFLRNFKK